MQHQEPWGDCPFGILTGMAGRLRRRKRQTQVRAVSLIGLGLLLLSLVGYGLATRDVPDSRARLNCRETIPLFAKYHDRSLDGAVESDVREHLSRCPACREHYDQLYPNEAQNRSLAENRLLAVAAQFRR
ncbi:MAG: zf-HC2 domain-containing protein [Planctomycetota bacterium]